MATTNPRDSCETGDLLRQAGDGDQQAVAAVLDQLASDLEIWSSQATISSRFELLDRPHFDTAEA
jgi:hypothetical protein